MNHQRYPIEDRELPEYLQQIEDEASNGKHPKIGRSDRRAIGIVPDRDPRLRPIVVVDPHRLVLVATTAMRMVIGTHSDRANGLLDT